jgi:hypothetical protein
MPKAQKPRLWKSITPEGRESYIRDWLQESKIAEENKQKIVDELLNYCKGNPQDRLKVHEVSYQVRAIGKYIGAHWQPPAELSGLRAHAELPGNAPKEYAFQVRTFLNYVCAKSSPPSRDQVFLDGLKGEESLAHLGGELFNHSRWKRNQGREAGNRKSAVRSFLQHLLKNGRKVERDTSGKVVGFPPVELPTSGSSVASVDSLENLGGFMAVKPRASSYVKSYLTDTNLCSFPPSKKLPLKEVQEPIASSSSAVSRSTELPELPESSLSSSASEYSEYDEAIHPPTSELPSGDPPEIPKSHIVEPGGESLPEVGTVASTSSQSDHISQKNQLFLALRNLAKIT